ncbi:terminase, partial [Pseudoalteromonas sp. S979]
MSLVKKSLAKEVSSVQISTEKQSPTAAPTATHANAPVTHTEQNEYPEFPAPSETAL